MANLNYPVTRKAALDALLSGKTPRAFLSKAAYNAAHDFYDDVKAQCVGHLGSSTRGNGAEITTPTTTGGVLDGDDTLIQNVPADTYAALIVIADDGSADATSRLVCFIDDAAAGLPITTTGRDVVITWDNGAAKITAF